MVKRRKRQTPIALLWTRRDQLRFIQAVERFADLVNRLETLAGQLERLTAGRRARAARQPVVIDGQAVEEQTP